jgi:hypothetical protein
MSDITVIYDSKILRWLGLEGIVLYPFVILSTTKEKTRTSVFKHEITHVYQVKREGFFCFYCKYLCHIFKKACSCSTDIFIENEFEDEAYDNENNPLNKEELQLLNLSLSFPKTDKLYKSKKVIKNLRD